MLTTEQIGKHLTARTVGRDLRVHERVPSTNEALRELARAGAPEGTVVIADEQTAGRGRQGQPWFSPPGVNLYASVLFRPSIPADEAPAFSFIASLALSDAIQAEGLVTAIKWPNDILVGRKKVAGTLAEAASRGRQAEYVILGFGVNVNVRREALREALGAAARNATSLAEAAGRELDRNALAARVLDALEAWAETYARRGHAPVLAAWRDRDILGGRRVEVRGPGESIEGRVLGVDRQGALVLRDAGGERRRVLNGDVRLLD